MKKSLLERLQETNPNSEIWWDSSPLVYPNWAKGILEKAPEEKKESWATQLEGFFNPEDTPSTFFRGVTTNPPLSLNVMKNDPKTWQGVVQSLIEEHPDFSVEEVFWLTYKKIVKEGAKAFLPLFESSKYQYGYISAQVDPRDIFQKEKMLTQALDLAKISPNIMVKVPGSKEGYEVISELTARGIATNNTLSMTVPQFVACIEAVKAGLKEAKEKNVSLTKWRSVITHMSARYGSLGDLAIQAKERGMDLSEEDIRWAEIGIFKRAYHLIEEKGYPTKMLLCSIRMGPDSQDGSATSWHIEKMAGGDIVYTCPPPYIGELMAAEDEMKPFDKEAMYQPVPKEALDRLMQIPYFLKSYEFDGMSPQEFNSFGPLMATATEFSKATRGMVDFIANEFQKVYSPKDFQERLFFS